MKKIYIQPNTVVVPLMPTQPIAGSLTTDGATFYDTEATGEAMTKENVPSNSSIWDEEW